ncbi:OmpL47-type beta-barrel domain-containing protein [Paenibacillus roseipurpureus]|uniref:Uncharacterized protein n=1 Tax=Paenibacillus roseopurpureus TaxID=2918901 RepID=A0AA96LMG6_9BACL|nr:hypothetical protein [Paenibacillus sp. MBLB1832]WNR44702.1 hypothetical protein MJB10_00605 [Paenibacillus sp. MBLB1832]
MIETAPITSSVAPTEWSEANATVKLTATDTGSGVAHTFYSLDGTNYVEGTTIDVNKNGANHIYFYSVDKAGNVEAVQTIEVKMDKTPPVTRSNAPAEWSKENVTVELTATDVGSGVAHTYYAVNGADFVEGTSFLVDKEGVNQISFYSVDIAGNVEEVKSAAVKIDRTPPVTVTNTPSEWSKERVTVDLLATDTGSGVAHTYYAVNGADFTEGTTLVVDKDGVNQISFYSVDFAGNVEELKTKEVKIDKTPPVTVSNAPTKWSKEAVNVELTATDIGTGVAHTYYAVNGADFVEGTSFLVDKEGVNQISFYSVDIAGNVEEVKSAAVKIDRTPPVTVTNTPSEWSKERVTVDLLATDTGSGVAHTYYAVNGADFTEGTTLVVDKDGVNQISFYSVDFAGNVEELKTKEVKIDKTPPVTVSNAPTKWSKEAVNVELTATDIGSGVAHTYYAVNEADFIEGTSFVVDKEGVNQISFYSVDFAGNVEAVKTAEIKIDKTPPVTISNAPTEWSKDKVTIKLTATDTGSGVAKTFYAINGADYVEGTSFVVDKVGINKISFYSVDKAGNKEAVQTAEVKIDNTAPVVTMDLGNEHKLGASLPLIYLAKDEQSGIAFEKMVVKGPDQAELIMPNGANLQLVNPGTYTITVTVTNKAGLSTTIERKFVVYVPATIEVTPKVIKGNSGVFTVRVEMPNGYKAGTSSQGFDLNTATINGVKALTSNNGYYNQAKQGQFKFERSDFNWTTTSVTLEFRCYMDGYLFIGQKTVEVQK